MICPHNILAYYGKQETLIAGKYLLLYNCKRCGTTLVVKEYKWEGFDD